MPKKDWSLLILDMYWYLVKPAIAGKGNDLLKNPDVGRLFLGG
jgi:hypothetical protein